MARKRSLGYVRLEWTCPNCNSRNPGRVETCENCGAPQPENVQFELPAEQKIVSDEKEIQAAQAGADIHCAFCGTRNPATAKICSQCGADLTEGQARQTGRELEPAKAQPGTVTCTNCSTLNPGTNTMCAKCGAPLPRAAAEPTVSGVGGPAKPAHPPASGGKKTNWLLLGGIGAALIICCVAVLALFVFPSSSVQGTVASVQWQTSVPLQEQREVHYSNEEGNPRAGAYDVSCRTDTRQVCEQKTIDRGNGYAEVVEECHDESTQYCSYDVMEWQTIQTYTLDGNDVFPVYADPNVSAGQRRGSESEELTVYFNTNQGQITYSPASVTEFRQYAVGSTWTLKLNALGGVLGVER